MALARPRLYDLVTANWPMKLTALALAAVLWAGVAAEQTTTRRLPIRLDIVAPPGHPLASPPPVVYAVFSGSARELLKLYASAPSIRVAVPTDVDDSTWSVQLVPGDVEMPPSINARPESIEPGWLTLALRDSAREPAAEIVERVIMGVPVSVPDGRSGGRWSSDPPAVIVTVRGPRQRVTRLTRDSVRVAAPASHGDEPGTVRLTVSPPSGVEATVTPDTAFIRRTRG